MSKKVADKQTSIAAVSMTGFGAGEVRKKTALGQVRVSVEIKTVNSRFLDPTIRLPRGYGAFEADVRELVSKSVTRGRLELVLNRAVGGVGGARTVTFNEALFDEYLKIYTLKLGAGKKLNPKQHAQVVRDVLGRSDVLLSEDGAGADFSAEWPLVAEAVKIALAALCRARAKEGQALGQDIWQRLDKIAAAGKEVAALAAAQPADLAARLRERVAKISGDGVVDAARLATEIALLADRVDTTEEMVRLTSHLATFRTTLATPQTGRRLDFLVQEIGRELNTVGSKAQVAAIQQLVVGAKSELEKIREQVQNIE